MIKDMTVSGIKEVGDYAAGGFTIATVMGYMPGITAFFTMLYVIVRFYETQTVQNLITKWKNRKASKMRDHGDDLEQRSTETKPD